MRSLGSHCCFYEFISDYQTSIYFSWWNNITIALNVQDVKRGWNVICLLGKLNTIPYQTISIPNRNMIALRTDAIESVLKAILPKPSRDVTFYEIQNVCNKKVSITYCLYKKIDT